MIDVGIRPLESPNPRIFTEIALHILVNFLLEVNANGAVTADDHVRAHAGISRYVPAWIRNYHVFRIIPDSVSRSLDRSGGEATIKTRRIQIGTGR